MQTWKNTIKLGLFLFILGSCNQEEKKEEEKHSSPSDNYINADNAWYYEVTAIQGETQGTTFTIKTSNDTLLVSPLEVSELFKNFDSQLSGYISSSMLTIFNKSEDSIVDIDSYPEFVKCYELSQDIFKRTNGAFDPSVFPLVKAWGFFKEMNDPPNKAEIDSLLTFIGFENGKHHTMENNQLKKLDSRFELDFNAIAQGLSVDYIAEYLDEKDQEDYFIEIGGEIRTKGLNNEDKPWIIGIDQPKDENTGLNQRDLENYIGLENVSVATSGNYRKFYEKDGRRYSHTLNPKTGYPVEHNLLSTTVIAKNASIADGYATAFMTMGVEKTMEFVKNNPDLNLEVYLLFENKDGRLERAYSSGMNDFFLK